MIKSSSAYIVPGLQSIDQIIDGIISDSFGTDVSLLYLRSRKRIGAEPRQFAMWWRERNTKESLSVIGARYGGRDHATVLHAKKTVNNMIETDMQYRAKAEQALSRLAKSGYTKTKIQK